MTTIPAALPATLQALKDAALAGAAAIAKYTAVHVVDPDGKRVFIPPYPYEHVLVDNMDIEDPEQQLADILREMIIIETDRSTADATSRDGKKKKEKGGGNSQRDEESNNGPDGDPGGDGPKVIVAVATERIYKKHFKRLLKKHGKDMYKSVHDNVKGGKDCGTVWKVKDFRIDLHQAGKTKPSVRKWEFQYNSQATSKVKQANKGGGNTHKSLIKGGFDVNKVPTEQEWINAFREAVENS